MKLESVDFGLMFVGAILALVGLYLVVFQEDPTSRWFGGGAVLVVALFLFILPAFRKKKK